MRERIKVFPGLTVLILITVILLAGCNNQVVSNPGEKDAGEDEGEREVVGVRSAEGDPVIGLSLSGGGGLGIAHIGVLEVFIENEIPIDIITGTSAGALVGALYADGLSIGEMKDILEGLSWADLLETVVPDLGFFGTGAMQEILEKNIRASTFSDLALPLAVVATNLDDGEEVVLDQGPLAQAVVASAAIPVVFKPVEYEDMMLVDGGLVNNLPSDRAREMGADIVIAVNLAVNFRFEGRPEGLIDTGIRSYNILQKSHSKPVDADLEIHPDLGGITGTDLSLYPEIIDRGREAAERVLPDIKELLEKKARSD